ncbi:MAG: tetratricopeptide repeat-containing sulfotransferase family protein [Lysobacter sp.]
MSANKLWEGAEAAVDRKDFARAEQLYRRALATQGSHVPSLLGLSTVLSRRGSHREARAAALAAYAHRPSAAPLIYALAQRLRYFHEFERLVDCLSAPSLALEAPAEIQAKASVMLSSVGAHDAAAQLADKALRRDPANAAALHVRGNYYLFQGDVDKAEQSYEASLRSDPLLFQNSWMLAGARPQTSERNHVERLKRQLLQAKPRGTGEVYVAYALHKELHDLGRYDEAWQALERACAAKRRQSPYALSEHVELVDSLLQVCTPEFVGASSSVNQPRVPIFIVGMHRSGTTLLERMLAGHSQVGDAGETSAFHAQLERAIDQAAPTGMDAAFAKHVTTADFDAIARGYAETAVWLSRGNPYFTEKLPPNFFNVGFIAKAMPQARFLHLVRDPMDTCFSNLRTLFSGTALYSYDQAELGGFFLQYQRMMEHWRAVLPGRVLDISYDELVRDPADMAERVAAHCGLAFEPGMVDIGRASGTVATPSATVAREGFRRDRGRAWQPYEEHLRTMRATLAPAYGTGDSAPN